MRRHAWLLVLASVLVAARTTHAAPEAELQAAATPKRYAASLELGGLNASGVAGSFELFAARHRMSLVANAGYRHTASGDFSGHAFAIGGELRWWWSGSTLVSAQKGMVGPYVGLRLDVSPHFTSYMGKSIGKTLSIGESINLGYRFVIADRVELTPSAGFALRSEIEMSGPLESWHRTTLVFGLTLGYLFD